MFPLRQVGPSHRKAIPLYLLTIAGPTVVLLFLGLQSVRRQRQAIANLTVSNLRLSGERLAAEIERRVARPAEALLRDSDFVRLLQASGETESPEGVRSLRARLESLRALHPIARRFFVLQGTQILFPLLRTPPPRSLDAVLAREDPKVGERFRALFIEAENHELREHYPDLALPTYRQCYELQVSDSLKALALARVARCWQKMSRPKEAEQAYRVLSERYGDSYDLLHRPYALIAGLELDGLARAQGNVLPRSLVSLRRDLLHGRWELSVEQMDYFRRKLDDRLGEATGRTDRSEYLGDLELARALEEGFRPQGSLRAGEVYAYALTRGQKNYQTYYTPLRSGGERETLVGFAVNLDWVEHQLLPQCRSDLGMQGDARIIFPSTSLRDGEQSRTVRDDPKASGGASETRVVFPTLFPFWELSLAPAPGAAGQASARRDMVIFAGSTLLVLCVLVLGVLLLMRDVSRELKLNQLRSDFVSSVSHELKTPLTLIRLYAETLLHGENFVEEERRGFYQIITRESERLSQLIEKVLGFARIERGQTEYQLAEGDLAESIAGTVEAYSQYLLRRGFSIETHLAAHLPPVQFDPEAVSQAVLNLLDNAVKYSGESKFVGASLRSEDNKVIFEIEDHGMGVSADERQKIFERFYRGRGGSEKGGYGLGLFLVRHIMEAHGGSVEVESELGRGSRFRLIFPVSATAPAPQP